MLLPAQRVLQALVAEVRLLGGGGNAGAVASAEQSVAVALGLLGARESNGVEAVREQFRRLCDVLARWPGSGPGVTEQPDALARLEAQAQRAAQQGGDLHVLEDAWRDCLRQAERVVGVGLRDSRVDASTRTRLAGLLVDWEAADLQSQVPAAAASVADETSIDVPRLQAYLRDRFDEPGLAVTDFRPLPGGFGKQTCLFEVQGKALSGGYVMRRDHGVTLIDNDCHRIHHEYAVIRAVHARGFPAPQALWCDTEHRLLPGGDFLVMRRAPGVAGGSAFGASGSVPADLGETLALILARLHALPPLDELHRLTGSINAERASSSLHDCTRRYLEDWLELYSAADHLPSPAIVAQFGWLLDHVPCAEGRPVLLHGDIGFHNFLFEEGADGRRLSAVLDWEFAHLGDPAEDLAYVRNTVGAALDWPAFLAAYRAAGGADIDDERIRFFEAWGHLRNAASSSLAAGLFMQGRVPDLKMVLLPHAYIPLFLRAAQAAMEREVK